MSAAKSSDPKTRASGTKKESSDSSHAALQRKNIKIYNKLLYLPIFLLPGIRLQGTISAGTTNYF